MQNVDVKALEKIAWDLMRDSVKTLKACGYTWKQIERKLKLKNNNGMDAWRKAGNKHFKTKRRRVA